MVPVSNADHRIRKVGPCGGIGGDVRAMDPSGVTHIVKIGIRHGHAIDALFVNFERNGSHESTRQWGWNGGKLTEILFEANEYIIAIKGHVGTYNNYTILRSLKFETNFRIYGPYGKKDGKPFQLSAQGGQIIGFHGRSGQFVDAIGVYVKGPIAVQVPPSSLHQQLSCLLEHGYGTDVSFDVRGVTFDAHRCVLAARSAVFRALLFGPLKVEMNQTVKIKDMEPSIFKSLLHFIYSDSVPDLEVKGIKDVSLFLAQHLLVAADRYGLERLRKLCEIKLYMLTDANNVATTLALAEQHNCSELKAACLEFIKPPEVLAAVVLTEGFKHMIRSCPEILNELRKMKNLGR